MNTTAASHDQNSSAPDEDRQTGQRAFVRPAAGRMLAGVASGIAGYLGVDVLLIRIAFVVLTLVGGAGIPLYLACWLLIPDEISRQSIVGDVLASQRARRG